MLLDEKRTKRIVQVVAILTSIAFVGTIFVVLAIVLFGGGASPERDQVNEIQSLVEDAPENADLWQQLASAHIAAGDQQEAVDAAQRSVDLAPDSFRNVSTLALALQQAGDDEGAVDALQEFTNRNRQNAEAFLQLGQAAQGVGRTAVARLAYQRFLDLEPESARAEAVRELLAQLTGQALPDGVVPEPEGAPAG
ncbi:MAG: tetratricopeptide repeat protein [Miltoncostaeaceae bacterium]